MSSRPLLVCAVLALCCVACSNSDTTITETVTVRLPADADIINLYLLDGDAGRDSGPLVPLDEGIQIMTVEEFTATGISHEGALTTIQRVVLVPYTEDCQVRISSARFDIVNDEPMILIRQQRHEGELSCDGAGAQRFLLFVVIDPVAG